jgi:glyoxylate reductase
MKRGAILINTARGGIVDQSALYEALKSGALAHVGLDVTDPEPIARDDSLLRLDNVTVVPHVASATRSTRFKMAMMCVENVIAGIRGDAPPYCVNPEAKQNRI